MAEHLQGHSQIQFKLSEPQETKTDYTRLTDSEIWWHLVASEGVSFSDLKSSPQSHRRHYVTEWVGLPITSKLILVWKINGVLLKFKHNLNRSKISVTDLQYTVQCSLVQSYSSLVHHACPDYVHRVGGQSPRQATCKTGPGGQQDRSTNGNL